MTTAKVPTGGKSSFLKAVDDALNFRGGKEQTFWDTSYNLRSQFAPFNSDPLWQRDGDYTTYEQMLDDDQVDVALQLKKDMVLGSGFEFVAGDKGQEDIIADLDKSFVDECSIPFEDKLEEVLSAYEFGFSSSEKIYRKRDDGSLAFGALKTRHPNTWLFEQDVHGNIKNIIQRGTFEGGDVTIKNNGSILHYINRPRFQNAYGRSDLLACFAAWRIKKEIVKFKAVYMEKAASPTPVARYDDNVPQEAVDDIHAAIQKLQTKTALTIPKAIEMEFLEASNNGEVFIKAINLFNMFISRALFIPDLLGLGGSETSGGSFSLGKEQMAVFFRHINRRRRTLETYVNRELVRPLILFNFGDIENPPKFKFKPISDQDAIDLATVWLTAVNGKTFKPNEDEVNHFRDLVKFPQGAVELVQPAPSPGFGNGNDVPGAPPSGGLPTDPDQDPEGDLSTVEGEAQDDIDKMGGFPKENKSNFEKVFDLPPGDFHKRTNFKTIEAQMQAATEKTLERLLPVTDDIIADLQAQIERKKIIKNQDMSKIGTLKLKKLAELNRVVRADLKEIFKIGQASAQKELIKGNFALPVPTDKFLENLEAETFQYVGDLKTNIDKKTAIKLRQAIKDGTPLSAVLDEIAGELKDEFAVSIERFSRTKTTEVFNRGRQAFFETSGVVQGYQYSAVMDDRTTVICSGLNGKIFKEGTQPLPPLHFSCRSILVPITIFEDLEPTEKIQGQTPDAFIKDNIGKGFSKQ